MPLSVSHAASLHSHFPQDTVRGPGDIEMKESPLPKEGHSLGTDKNRQINTNNAVISTG